MYWGGSMGVCTGVGAWGCVLGWEHGGGVRGVET